MTMRLMRMKIRFFVNIHLKIKDFGVGTLSSSYFFVVKKTFLDECQFFWARGLYTKYRKVKKGQ